MLQKLSNGINPRFAAFGSRHLRWIENVTRYLRDAGDAHAIISLRHTGWYIDSFMEQCAVGAVFQLPARGGVPQFLAAVRDPYCKRAALVDFETTYETTELAAREADRFAQRYAEQSREDSAKQLAEGDIESARDAIKRARAELHALMTELRNSAPLGTATCNAVRSHIARVRHEVRHLVRIIRERRENFWSAVER